LDLLKENRESKCGKCGGELIIVSYPLHHFRVECDACFAIAGPFATTGYGAVAAFIAGIK
jgi:hypothetical protein